MPPRSDLQDSAQLDSGGDIEEMPKGERNIMEMRVLNGWVFCALWPAGMETRRRSKIAPGIRKSAARAVKSRAFSNCGCFELAYAGKAGLAPRAWPRGGFIDGEAV